MQFIKHTILLSAFGLLMSTFTVHGQGSQVKLYKSLTKYVKGLDTEFESISEERADALHRIGDYILEELADDQTARVLFICTHNSRRSQLGQVWLQTAAYYYGVEGISTSSGGTEGTAFNPRAIAALERAGFEVDKNPGPDNDKENPQYLVKLSSKLPGILTYSKKYSDPFNPQEDFTALMVCSEADKSCPFVPGADARFSLPYEDPRYYDNTPAEQEQYDARCRQIATEMFFLMGYVKGQRILTQEQSR